MGQTRPHSDSNSTLKPLKVPKGSKLSARMLNNEGRKSARGPKFKKKGFLTDSYNKSVNVVFKFLLSKNFKTSFVLFNHLRTIMKIFEHQIQHQHLLKTKNSVMYKKGNNSQKKKRKNQKKSKFLDT